MFDFLRGIEAEELAARFEDLQRPVDGRLAPVLDVELGLDEEGFEFPEFDIDQFLGLHRALRLSNPNLVHQVPVDDRAGDPKPFCDVPDG